MILDLRLSLLLVYHAKDIGFWDSNVFLFIGLTLAKTSLVFSHGLFHFLRLSEVCSNHKRSDCSNLISLKRREMSLCMCYALGLRITSSFYILMRVLPMLLFENTSSASCRSIFEIEGPLRDLVNDLWGLLLCDIALSSKCWVRLCDMLHVLLYQVLKIFARSIINYIDFGFKEANA